MTLNLFFSCMYETVWNAFKDFVNSIDDKFLFIRTSHSCLYLALPFWGAIEISMHLMKLKRHNNEWRQDRTTLITTTQQNEIKHFNTNVTFNNIYYKHWSSWYPSGRGKNHSPAAPAGPCHWCWALEGGTGKTRGMGEMEGSGAPVAALEWGLGRTHRRGLRGRRSCAGRPGTEVPPGCGSGSVGGCSGTLPGSWVWRRTWLWAAAGPGPDRTRGLWWAKSRWTGPGSSVGPLPGTSPGAQR